MPHFFLLVILMGTVLQVNAQQPKLVSILEVPGKFEYAHSQEKGISVLPSGRYISPAGEMIRITHDPLEMHDTRIFDVNKAMKKYKTTIDWNKIIKGPEMDKLEDMRADHYRQQKQAVIRK